MSWIAVFEYDIVIIDSGISLNSDSCIQGIWIEQMGDVFRLNDDLSDENGHGTLIYSVISKHIDFTRIFMVKLSERQADFDDTGLIAALEYIRDHVNCKVINISLGVKTSNNLGKLYHVCADMAARGTVIVSAFDNEGCHSYPATFDCVIGVDSSKDIAEVATFDFVEDSPVNILAKGNVQRIKTRDGRVLLVGGSSVACAHISALLASVMQCDINRYNALMYLKSKARYIYASQKAVSEANNTFFGITHAVVFPFAKEAHAFVRFADRLPFTIKGFYDVRQSGKVGRRLISYYEGAAPDACIVDVDKMDFAGVDTLILGHLDELNALCKQDFKAVLLAKAIQAGVNVYSFDSLLPYADILHNADIKYFYPKVTPQDVPQHTFGKLYKISTPVVGIFGTSSQQGKFSLQLALKRELEVREYNVGAIGTEPHTLLFGLDVVFPMGYNSTVRLRNDEIVLYLNNEINKLGLQGKEIILVASQAQIVPYYCNNLLEFPTMAYHFAIGTKPDAVVLCVNYHDEFPYIRNSMYALMGLTDATILALLMYPVTYASDWNGVYGNARHTITPEEFAHKAEALHNEFDVPVFLLGDQQHMHDLGQIVIDFF